MKLAAFALLLASPAAAECVTAADLATGIAFTREDGRKGVAVAEGKNVRLDYSTMADDWMDTRLSQFGVYDLWANFHFDPLATVGGGYPHFDWTYAARLAVPVPGKTFQSKVTQKRSEDIGTEVEPPPDITTYQASYSFDAAKQVKLSGCPYTIIPVEAAYSDGSTQRYLYFPDLGLGLETRSRGFVGMAPARRGLTALTPKS